MKTLAIRRYSVGRIFVVTLGLAVVGALLGAVAGVFTLAICLTLSSDFEHLREPRLFAAAATLGAMVGTACVPPAWWLLLQGIPPGRALAGLTLGAIGGGVAGWLLPRSFAHGDGILITAALGFLGAAVILRSAAARAIRHR